MTLRRSVQEATDRIQGIIDAAEEAAEQIRLDAETEAQNYLAVQRREADRIRAQRAEDLSKLTADLSGRADAVRAEIDAMIRALGDVTAHLNAPEPAAPPPPAAKPEPAESAPEAPSSISVNAIKGRLRPEPAPSDSEPKPEPQTDPEQPEPEAEPVAQAPAEPQNEEELAESAMLRATQMAVAGSSREDIEQALRNDYRVKDSESILNEILGPG